MTDQQRAAEINRDAEQPTTYLDEVRRPHNVVAAFQTMDDARDAILALERAGIDGDNISLLGARPAADEGDDGDVPERPAEGVVAGAAAGAVATGGLGALVSLTIPGVGPVLALGLGAVAGAAGGALIGAAVETGSSAAWRETFATAAGGSVAVGVHTQDGEEADLGHETLSAQEPMAINRFEDSEAES